MRRDHPTALFDAEVADLDDLADEFWGATRDWVSRDTPVVGRRSPRPSRSQRNDTTGSLWAIREGFAAFRPRHPDDTGRIESVGRTRRHGVVQRESAPVARREATLGELASGRFDDDAADWVIDLESGLEPTAVGTGLAPDRRAEMDHDADGFVELSPTSPLTERLGLGAVDPRLIRLGVLLLVGVLMVPVALALRPTTADGAVRTGTTGVVDESIDAPATGDAAGSAPAAVDAIDTADPTVEAGADGSNVDGDAATATSGLVDSPASADLGMGAAASTAASATASGDGSAVASSPAPADGGSVGDTPATASSGGISEGATVAATAERVVPACPLTYVAAAGDSWYRIADAAGIGPAALLAENTATFDTVIFPGDEICLPAGATAPSPPPAPTTAPPTTTVATTVPSTTTAPPGPVDVEAIIRDVWPDELEEKALAIAWRESRYDPNAHNGWCCYGLFQIYWTVHAGWLDDYGIDRASDLYDARKNARAAYALYQRSGGWGPWGG